MPTRRLRCHHRAAEVSGRQPPRIVLDRVGRAHQRSEGHAQQSWTALVDNRGSATTERSMEVRAEMRKSALCPATAATSSEAGARPGLASPLMIHVPINKPQAINQDRSSTQLNLTRNRKR
ncbi:hypothetical protein NDU88_006172 [Pleurodeles waltl]|uniref:Uncharacterized protein n=1 Tax=Pleurodeles waltl TaxID=8319 RepID=A0AAV7TD66_PLEWA|nr:hypothetical protein NDU88_006172 [Pleurodeles waltl]